MSNPEMNVLETSHMSSKLITIAAALLVLLFFGIGAGVSQAGVLDRADGKGNGPTDPPVFTCTSSVLPHFPLQGGNQWNYTKRGPGDPESWQVSVVSGTEDATSVLQGYFGASRTVCAGTGGVIHEMTADTGGDMWYDLGGTVGSVWVIHLDAGLDAAPDCVNGSSVTIASRTEHVDVPAGSFDNVIRVDYQSPCMDAGILSEWFAPGVGLVKRTEQSFSGPVTSELESASIGGVLLPAPAVTTSLAVGQAVYTLPSDDLTEGPSLTANLVLRNTSATPGRFTFMGCASMTVRLIDKTGKAVRTAHATDGSECKGTIPVNVEVSGTPLGLPISIALADKREAPLVAGRYLVVATLDTLDAPWLQPVASSTIDIQYASTGSASAEYISADK